MSYSFNWDCTLPITNIQDIVSINIVPETQSYNEGDYLSIRGHISIDGEYVSLTGEQNVFNESIPLDITLPNTGRNGEIKVDVTNFDYDIKDDGKLCLDLNLSIAGYDLDSIPTLIEEKVEVPKEQAPVLFTKEAIVSHPVPKSSQAVEVDDDHTSAFINTDDVEYLDFDDAVMPSHQVAVELIDEKDRQEVVELIEEEGRQEVVELIEEEDYQEVVELIDEEEEDRQEVVELIDEEEANQQEVVELVVEEEEGHHNEVVDEVERKEKLTDKIKQLIKKEPVVESNLIQENVIIESQPVAVESVIEEHPIVEEVSAPQAVVEEVIVEVEPIVEETKPIVKPKPVMPIPVVTAVVEPEVEEVIKEEEETEILPFPLKTTSSVIVQPQPTVVDKSNIFDMLYELDEEEIEVIQEEAPVVETIVTPTAVPQAAITPVIQSTAQQVVIPTPQPIAPQPVVAPVIQSTAQQVVTPTPQPSVEEVPVTLPMYDDSIASQFADGESIIKIVFVQEEELTLTDLVTKYSVQEENVYNCNNLNFPLCQGDRVMINYGSYRGR